MGSGERGLPESCLKHRAGEAPEKVIQLGYFRHAKTENHECEFLYEWVTSGVYDIDD